MFSEIMSSSNLTSEQVYYDNKTSMFLYYMPQKLLCESKGKAESGIKDSKE